MRRAFLYGAASLISTVRHAYAAKTYFVDASCAVEPRIQNVVIPEALSLAATASQQQGDPDFNNVVNLIYQGIKATDNFNLFGGAVSAFCRNYITLTRSACPEDIDKISNIQPATNQNSANIIFYCDDDARWRFATSEEVFGNDDRPDSKKAWFDPVNEIIFDVRSVPLDQNSDRETPGCRGNTPTNAQTYVNTAQPLNNPNPDLNPGDKVTITLCSNLYLGRRFLAIGDIPPDVNLAATTTRNNKRQPGIDAYKLTSVIVVHEVASLTPWCL